GERRVLAAPEHRDPLERHGRGGPEQLGAYYTPLRPRLAGPARRPALGESGRRRDARRDPRPRRPRLRGRSAHRGGLGRPPPAPPEEGNGDLPGDRAPGEVQGGAGACPRARDPAAGGSGGAGGPAAAGGGDAGGGRGFEAAVAGAGAGPHLLTPSPIAHPY